MLVRRPSTRLSYLLGVCEMTAYRPAATYLAVIPARGGSKGVPGKNIKILNGKPLIAWTIEHALQVLPPKDVIVSTDNEAIAGVARRFGASVPFIRPSELATDEAGTEPVINHCLSLCGQWSDRTYDAVILLQPTSPYRREGTLISAIEKFERSGADSLLSLTENHHFFWQGPIENLSALYDFTNRPRRQDVTGTDLWLRENGSIYITKVSNFIKFQNRLSGTIVGFLMSQAESHEIDSLVDFEILSTLMRDVT